MMSLPVMPTGDRFFMSRKARTGGDGRVHPKGENSMAMSFVKPLVRTKVHKIPIKNAARMCLSK